MVKRGATIRRADANQPAIVAALRKLGYGVLDIHEIGKGSPDLVVSDGNNQVLVEVKSHNGHFTPDELEFKEKWPGEIVTAFSHFDVIAWFTKRKAAVCHH